MIMTLLNYSFQYKDLNNGKFLLEINQKYFTVESELVVVLGILKDFSSYDEATKKYNELKSENHSVIEFEEYARSLVESLDLEKRETSFLLWEYPLLSPKNAGWIAQYFKFLFNPSLFFFTFFAFLLLGLYIIFGVDSSTETSGKSFLYIIIAYALSTLVHELGHIAACQRFTGKNGEIGVGVYIFYPIFYSNISAIWMANTKQRIVTNLAGIYMQLMLGIIFLILYFINGDQFYIEFAKVLSIFSLFQIMPFIRSDGYWIVSDLLNEPNLLQKSNNALWESIKRIFGFKKEFSVKLNYQLILYSLFNYGVVFYFLFYQISQNSKRLLDFPFYIMNCLKDFLSFDFEHLSIDWGYIPVFIFYFIIYQYGKRLFNAIMN